MRNQDCSEVEYEGHTYRVLAVNEPEGKGRVEGRIPKTRSVVLQGRLPMTEDFYRAMCAFFGVKQGDTFTVVGDLRGQRQLEAS